MTNFRFQNAARYSNENYSYYDVIPYYSYITSAVHETCVIDLQTSSSNILQHLAIAGGPLATLLPACLTEQNYTRGCTAVETLPTVEQLFLFALHSPETCMRLF
jgi:hypothetical protein